MADTPTLRREFLSLLREDLAGQRARTRFDDFLHVSAVQIQIACLEPGCADRTALEREYMGLAQGYRDRGRIADFDRFSKMLGALAALIKQDIAAGGEGDALSQIMSEAAVGGEGLGQFFSPGDVAKLAAALNSPHVDIPTIISRKGFVSVHEPAAGSGAMVLAYAAEVRALGFDPGSQMWASAWELEATAAQACFLQLALAGIPAIVTEGNTLTRAVVRVWNTPAMFRIWELFPDIKHGTDTP